MSAHSDLFLGRLDDIYFIKASVSPYCPMHLPINFFMAKSLFFGASGFLAQELPSNYSSAACTCRYAVEFHPKTATVWKCPESSPAEPHRSQRASAFSSLGLQLCSVTLALEVSVGKTAVIFVKNGTDVLLPCTFSSCIGIERANFSWISNSTEIFKGIVKNKDSKPEPYPEYRSLIKYELPTDIALSKDNREFNVSLLLLFAEFSDSGKYTCFVKNPREKNANHSATITLKVVVEMEKKDNTLTVIIVSVVGGVIGLLVLIMLIKKVTLFILKKTREKECLVTSSGNDNTENGLAGSKAEQKSAPKA
ncbi:sodium channel subunit beta-4 [Zootoca vivipara]|uniref:sodium channel subunit beta-4 n=1 Tax=Zootoca vivipara TaxID=8524 RepID=UPI001590F224|nr:sodium channel subunit beta-4 [Zootoca vivipara]